MKTLSFTLTAVGLGLIAGLTLAHYHQVKGMVVCERVGVNHTSSSGSEKPMAIIGYDATSPKRTGLETGEGSGAAAYKTNRSSREDVLLDILAEIRKEQKQMYKQMAEQNREVAELTFRVDSHSDSFKPLRMEAESPPVLDLNRGYKIPNEDDEDSLLPPKPAASQ